MNKFNFYGAIIGASSILTVSVILAELMGPFKNMLTSLFTHHWIGKLALTIAAFILFGYLIQKNELFGRQLKKIAWNATIINLTIIFLFFIIIYFT